MYCLIEHAGTEIELRIIDLVIILNLAELGFKTQYEENARPAYHPSAPPFYLRLPELHPLQPTTRKGMQTQPGTHVAHA